MNNVDKQYLNILKDIIENGNYKNTRAGETKSLFGKQMRFNLKDGFPLLTTKKVFTKGIIHELLWFLKGDTNIKYLVDNNVHIWDDDAYRYYKELCNKINRNLTREFNREYSKEEFINRIKNENFVYDTIVTQLLPLKSFTYKLGNLGPIYGEQWRNWGGQDQIKNIVNVLKTNPNDRRIILTAFNVDELSDMALPPCHIMAQFYTKEMNTIERLNWLCEHNDNKYDEWKSATSEKLDELSVPKYALSCMFFCRSQDFPLGTPFNIASYALLTHMIAQVCNMDVDELIWNGGDCHVYLNQIDSITEQLSRKGYDKLPTLVLNKNVKDIDDFKFEDIKIENYQCEDVIKVPLSVGL